MQAGGARRCHLLPLLQLLPRLRRRLFSSETSVSPMLRRVCCLEAARPPSTAADEYSGGLELIPAVGRFQNVGVNAGVCVCRANPWGRQTPGRSSASCPSTAPPPCSWPRPPSEPSASRTPTPPSGESTPCPGKRKPERPIRKPEIGEAPPPQSPAALWETGGSGGVGAPSPSSAAWN